MIDDDDRPEDAGLADSPPTNKVVHADFVKMAIGKKKRKKKTTSPSAWPGVGKYGTPLSTYRNARAAIQKLGIAPSYDIFHDRLLLKGDVMGEQAGEFSDAASAVLRQIINDKFNFDPGKNSVNDAAMALCLKHSFDPICDYLNGLQWDGIDRLTDFLKTYFGADPTPLNSEFGKLGLVAAVRRVRRPGCKFDNILVLEGFEGRGKSSAISELAGEDNFSDQNILTESDKVQQELVRGVWLYEIADLAGMRRGEVERIKAFGSRTHDRARPAFGRHRVDAPRRCIFIGTTNENDGYLKSQTGNRRFWPVHVRFVDLAALRRDRDQLWAQAAALEATGMSLVLDEKLWPDARIEQEERRERDPWEDILADVDGGGVVYAGERGNEERLRTRELLEDKLRLQPKEISSVHTGRLKRTMNALGWTGPKKLRFGGRDTKSERGYYRLVKLEPTTANDL
jgi:hypothetical protein